eukprot:TRINITY_DN12886_c0_g1_i4.p1 TRINITY_DN12886_c0_g1~~TRINITY_DN12886_c0_g1_i4.p1  ORF type:complete len:881 (+),score=240.94 TRINITY_DN12886_c0_g1_i4:116-2758(+)
MLRGVGTLGSFRPRAIDLNKPLPIIHREIEEDDSNIHRAVPLLPSGMEPEEEEEAHIASAISSFEHHASGGGGGGSSGVRAIDVPIPMVQVVDGYDTYKDPHPYIHSDHHYIFYKDKSQDEMDAAIEYDMDTDDERWLVQYNSSSTNHSTSSSSSSSHKLSSSSSSSTKLSEDTFELVVDRCEKEIEYRPNTEITIQRLEPLCKGVSKHHLQAVLSYWNAKYLRREKMTQIRRFLKPPDYDDPSPYRAFRPREKEKKNKQGTRRNDLASYTRMREFRRELEKARTLLEMMKKRERLKKEYVGTLSKTYEVFLSEVKKSGHLSHHTFGAGASSSSSARKTKTPTTTGAKITTQTTADTLISKFKFSTPLAILEGQSRQEGYAYYACIDPSLVPLPSLHPPPPPQPKFIPPRPPSPLPTLPHTFDITSEGGSGTGTDDNNVVRKIRVMPVSREHPFPADLIFEPGDISTSGDEEDEFSSQHHVPPPPPAISPTSPSYNMPRSLDGDYLYLGNGLRPVRGRVRIGRGGRVLFDRLPTNVASHVSNQYRSQNNNNKHSSHGDVRRLTERMKAPHEFSFMEDYVQGRPPSSSSLHSPTSYIKDEEEEIDDDDNDDGYVSDNEDDQVEDDDEIKEEDEDDDIVMMPGPEQIPHILHHNESYGDSDTATLPQGEDDEEGDAYSSDMMTTTTTTTSSGGGMSESGTITPSGEDTSNNSNDHHQSYDDIMVNSDNSGDEEYQTKRHRTHDHDDEDDDNDVIMTSKSSTSSPDTPPKLVHHHHRHLGHARSRDTDSKTFSSATTPSSITKTTRGRIFGFSDHRDDSHEEDGDGVLSPPPPPPPPQSPLPPFEPSPTPSFVTTRLFPTNSKLVAQTFTRRNNNRRKTDPAV